jgi:hypothetical protein
MTSLNIDLSTWNTLYICCIFKANSYTLYVHYILRSIDKNNHRVLKQSSSPSSSSATATAAAAPPPPSMEKQPILSLILP